MADLRAIQKSYLEEQRAKLERWTTSKSTVVIKEAADSLFEVFESSENFADMGLQEDLLKTTEKLEEGKKILAKQETDIAVCEKLIDAFTDMAATTSRQSGVEVAESKDIENIKKKIQTKMTGMEKYLDIPPDFLEDLHTEMDVSISEEAIKNKILTFKGGVKENDKIKDKIVVIMMELACVNNLVVIDINDVTKNQISRSKTILTSIDTMMNQINAHQTVCNTIELLDKRIQNFEWLETADPKKLPKKSLNKTSKTTISIDLKNKFLKPGALEEEPKGYEISNPVIKNSKNETIKIFQDDIGTEFDKTVKTGASADIFIKSWSTYVKIGKIGISNTIPAKLDMEIDAYVNLPLELGSPTSIEMQARGVGREAWGTKDKVSISKKLLWWLEKPSFKTEYDDLDTIIHQDEKLKKMYDNLYETFLEDQLDKFFANHPEESMRNGRAGLSPEAKKTFFVDIVNKNSVPAWAVGIPDLEKIRKDNVLSFDDFKKAFKKNTLELFNGRTKTQLKEHILEKLGTESFSKDNPTYAQWLLWKEIKKKYNEDKEKEALEMAANEFFLGIKDGSVKKAEDNDLYPGLEDARGNKTINASVADVEAISEEQAIEQANEEFARRYRGSIKRSLGRARMFFFRTRIVNNKVKKIMKWKSKQLLTDSETTSAVNRRMLKKDLKMAGADKIKVETTVFNDPIFQEKLNNIVNEYLQDGSRWTKEAFDREVTEMIENNHELKVYTEKNKITQIGSNLIERVEFEKEQRKYYKEIIDITEDFASGKFKTRADYDKKIREKIGEFSDKQKRLPDLVKELKLDLNAIDFSEKLVVHKWVLEKIRNRTVDMRINMLVNAKPRQEPKWMQKLLGWVQDDQRGLTTAQHVNIDKLWGRGKFYRWMEAHPRWTAIGTSIWLAWSAALFAPVASMTIGASLLFGLNYLKKRGHYTKEHVKFEKELLAMPEEQRESYIKSLKDDAEKRPERLRKVFPKKYDKYGASMDYLNKTQSLQQHIENIQRYTATGEILSDAQKSSLRESVIKGIAALKLQEDKGRNFMTSQSGKEDVEKLYNDLYNSVLWGIGRIDSSQKPIDIYNSIKSGIGSRANTILKNTDYEENNKKMESMRTKLWLFAGGKAAAIYLTTARLIGQIREWRGHTTTWGSETTATDRIHDIQIDKAVQNQMQQDLGKTIDFNHINANDQKAIIERFKGHGYSLDDATNEIYKMTSVPGGLQLDKAFGQNGSGQDLLNKVFDGDTAKFEIFKAKMNALQTGDRTSTLWWTMKEIYGTNQLATEHTRTFFDNFGKSIIENNQHELITLTSQSPLTSNGAQDIASKMAHRYTGSNIITWDEFRIVTDPAKIKDLFDGFAHGTYALDNLPTWRDLQTANDALHCKYGWFGDGLKEYIYDIANGSGKDVIGKIGVEDPIKWGVENWRNRLRFNSFGVPTFRNEVNNFKERK